MDNLTNVVNDILFDEIKQDQGVFKDVNIDTDGNILVGEKCLIRKRILIPSLFSMITLSYSRN